MVISLQAPRIAGRHGGKDGARIVGFADATPSLSWSASMENESDGVWTWSQSRSQVEITRARPGSEPVVSTVEYDGQRGLGTPVAWPLEPLTSRERVSVRVRAQGADGVWSTWSDCTRVEMGLLDNADWRSQPIATKRDLPREDAAPVFVRTFTIGRDEVGVVDAARLHITAAGVFVIYLDGQRLSPDEFAPGWTDYRNRFNAVTYDVSGMLGEGKHELAVLVGNGWYRGIVAWMGANRYGERLWLLAQLELLAADGSVSRVIGTDGEWSWRRSNILFNDFVDGQTTNLRQPAIGEPEERQAVETLPMPAQEIRPMVAPPARVVDTIPAREVITTPSGVTVLDFGQNVAGRVRFTVHGAKSGTRVTMRHAEVLEHGELGVRPLREAKATDVFILAGGGDEECEALLTQHGFRYVSVEGLPAAAVDPGDFIAEVISADMEPLAQFDCSEPDVNQLYRNTRWSMVDNFLSVPTDCPQRNERLGWTGDITVFSPTALSLFDAAAFLSSWLKDAADNQQPDGKMPFVVPELFGWLDPEFTSGWGDAAVVVPWEVYRATGDEQVLRRNLGMMDRFVDGVAASGDPDNLLWKSWFQFGDWLDPDAPPEHPERAKADPEVVSTAYFVYSTSLLAQAHEVLGDAEGAARYWDLHNRAKADYQKAYVTPTGAVLSDCQTVYAQALAWDLLETDSQREYAGNRLAELVAKAGYHISTGFLGTPLMCDALTKAGHADTAMKLLMQRECPSWLYPITMGATTIWERWDSMLPDGSINPGKMTSFNHYALGAVTHWLKTAVAGLEMVEPAYRRVRIAPKVCALGMTHASWSQRTPYGLIKVSWRREGDELSVEATLPLGVEAEVEVPGFAPVSVGAGRHTWRGFVGVRP